MSTPDTDRCARRASTSRKVAALTAIIQTLLPELFCKVGEEPDERLFVEMVKQGDPVSMAIANELTPEEIAAAFGWRDQPNGTMETEIRAMPVMAVLGEEQREAARVMCVAEEAADRIYALSHENKGTATGEGGAMRRYEDLFLEWLVRDLIEQRGEGAHAQGGASVDEEVDRLSEPWRSKGRKELAQLRRGLSALLGERG